MKPAKQQITLTLYFLFSAISLTLVLCFTGDSIVKAASRGLGASILSTPTLNFLVIKH